MSFQKSQTPKSKPKQKTGQSFFKKMILAIAIVGFVILGIPYIILISTILSAERSFNEQQVKEEMKNKLLISNSTAEESIDAREAIKQSHHEQQDESKLYQKSVVPPLDAPLMDNEKTACNFIRNDEDGDVHQLRGISIWIPIQLWHSVLFSNRIRGGSTALQSSVGKIFGLSNEEKMTEIKLTAQLSQLPEEYKCRLILAAPDAMIVKNEKNFQAIKGIYAMSEIIFNKPLKSLKACEVAFLSTGFRASLRWGSDQSKNYSVYSRIIQNNNLTCPKYEIMLENLKNLDRANHPIAKSLPFKNVPISVKIEDFKNLKQGILNAKKEMEKELKTQEGKTVVEVAIKQNGEIIRIDSLNRTQGFGSAHSPASTAKLLIVKSAIENGEPITSDRLKQILCKSSTETARKMFDGFKEEVKADVKADVKKYGLTHQGSLKNALTSENSQWSSDDILNFTDDFLKILDGKPKIANAFGQKKCTDKKCTEECTAGMLKDTIQPRYAIFAKTGTAENLQKNTAKLLLFALKDKQNKPITILIRIEGENNKVGLCSGNGCFDNGLFKHYLRPILKFTDKNQ